MAFSPDGRTLAIGNDDGTIGLWNVSDPAHAAPIRKSLTGPAGPVFSVTFSPDGRVLAAGDGGGDDTIRLWNVTSPAHATPVGAPLYGPGNTVSGVTFSPNGRLLAASSQDDKIWLWNVAHPADPTPVGEPLIGSSSSGPVYAVTFSPDGHTLASVSGMARAGFGHARNGPHRPDRHGRLGGVQPGRKTSLPPVMTTRFSCGTSPTWTALPLLDTGRRHRLHRSVAFSPEGTSWPPPATAAGSSSGTSSASSLPTPVGPPMTGSGPPFRSVAFSPDGKTLAAGSTDGTVRLWNVTSPADPTLIGSRSRRAAEQCFPWRSARTGRPWPRHL